MSQDSKPIDPFDPADAFAVPNEWENGPDEVMDSDPGTVFGASAMSRHSAMDNLPPLEQMSKPMAPPAYIAPVEDEYSDADETLSPVPRISIAAFCERPDTAQLIERASADRRLSRAQTTISMGGLPAAIEHYHDENTPNLILIESGMRGHGLFEQLNELAAVCDAGTKVVVIGAANDISLYRELMARGISEYLVPPIAPIQIVKTISNLFADPDKPFSGKVTAVIGAKGGVGSSTIAHNLAWQISENLQLGTTIIDLDLSFGTAGLDFNQDSAQGVGEALSDPDRVDDVLLERLMTKCTERLSVFTAPATLDREWEIDKESYETVISEVRATVPHVILDLPHIWTTWVKNTLLLADDVVIVASPDLACLRNAKNMYDLLKTRRSNDNPPKIIVNQVGVPKRPEISVKDFTEALGAEPNLVLPFEPELYGQATNNGQMLSEVNAASKAVAGIQSLAATITGREIELAKAPGFLGRLLGRK